MSSRLYPEWFIDGPWHGEDKRKKCPHLQGMIRCALPRPFNARQLLSNELTGEDMIAELGYDEYIYVPKWVDVFGERICVWVSETNAGNVGNSGATSQYPDWVLMLGQLVMSPHRIDTPEGRFNVGGIAQRHRERWDVEHEIRRDVRDEISELRRRNTILTRDLQRAQTARVLQAPSIHRLVDAPRSSAIIELKDDDGKHEFVSFENVILYLDEGDGTPENPPAWVATAQGPGDGDSDHKPPCMGYGTTKKAAIIALLADGLGVYARMIEISERMK
jgi:hypothetical protein